MLLSVHNITSIEMSEIKELKNKVEELETELYFCYRNKKIEKEVDG